MIVIDAVKAGLPLISVTTRDLMNFKEVVKYVTDKTPSMYNPEIMLKAGDLCYFQSDKPLQYPAKVYAKFAKAGATLMLVNSPAKVDEAFSAGELYAPITLVRKTLLEAYGMDHAKFVDELLPTLGGLSLTEVGEVIRLTEAMEGAIGPQGVTRTRAQLQPDMQGFSAVSTRMDGPYLPNEELAEFAVDHKQLFLNPKTDPRLVPRGLLADGLAGTGKTQGAKWLADQWGVPLYRLEATVLNKYFGESENNLKSIFSKVAQEAPCILLIDEAEKLLGVGEKGGDNSMMDRIRGMLLWQMQESRDRVFYLLTTNMKSKLPPELIREGRIEQVITFHGLLMDEAHDFAATILRSFVDKPDEKLIKNTMAMVDAKYGESDRLSHSAVTAAVKKAVKMALKHGG